LIWPFASYYPKPLSNCKNWQNNFFFGILNFSKTCSISFNKISKCRNTNCFSDGLKSWYDISLLQFSKKYVFNLSWHFIGVLSHKKLDHVAFCMQQADEKDWTAFPSMSWKLILYTSISSKFFIFFLFANKNCYVLNKTKRICNCKIESFIYTSSK
jgi:hypothetical protein